MTSTPERHLRGLEVDTPAEKVKCHPGSKSHRARLTAPMPVS
jgi:hypothetical protein